MYGLKAFVVLFFFNLTLSSGSSPSVPVSDLGYTCLFDKAFLDEMLPWRSCDMYVLSPKLDPTSTYKIEVNEHGVSFRSIPPAAIEVPVLLLASKIAMVDFCIENGGLKLKAESYDIGSASAYYKARDYIEFEWLKLTSKGDLFCVINNSCSIVTAFRVLFNPEPRQLDTTSLPDSTITIRGKISGDLTPSQLYIQGVRWLQLAINPGVVCKMISKKLAVGRKN